MKAIVIAAGLGNRLGELTVDRPKGMVRVGGRELILRVKDFLGTDTFSEYVVVTGYCAGAFRAFLAEHWPEARVLENPDFAKGSIKTIEHAVPYLDEGFLLMNVDHIYPKRMLSTVLKNRSGISAICDFDRALGGDDMKVKLDNDKHIAHISKTLNAFDCGYIGMTCCADDAVATYRSAIRQTLAQHGDTANVEAILGKLAADSVPVRIIDASGFGWLEVDTIEDLNHATNVLHNNPDYVA